MITGSTETGAVYAAFSTEVSVGGLAVQFPGAITSASDARQLASCAVDTIGQVPVGRWDAARLDGAGLLRAARHGGFVHGAELHDNGSIAVSPAEAAAMDPQQRLVLERGYEALHAARHERSTLGGSLSGVFLGIAANEFGQLLAVVPAGASVYAATGSSHSIACGRLSYVLGLHGPCVSYDTACSAALVACHAAVRSLQLAECVAGLSAGINLMLAPATGASFAVAGMTSPRGRSHTFDARSDGYARGEACCGVALACTGDDGRALGV